MKQLLILIILPIAVAQCNIELKAQYFRDNVWVMGMNQLVKNTIIDFQQGQFTAVVDSAPVGTPFLTTNTAISDSFGQLDFYSNGVNVFNRNFAIMANGSNLSPSSWTTIIANSGAGFIQGVLAIPISNPNFDYYLFHVTNDLYPYAYRPSVLYYSKINMQMNNGLGALITKNDTLINDTLISTGPVAVRHANGRDWWLLSHEWKTNRFYKWIVMPDSISNLMIQDYGPLLNSSSNASDIGQWTFSPDGHKLAFTYKGILVNNNLPRIIYLMDFNRCTGEILNYQTLNFIDSGYYNAGCCFSPNSRYLYVTSEWFVYQYDTYASNIQASKTVVGMHDGNSSYGTLPDFFSFLQNAPDGKIYIASGESATKLHVINSPDSAGFACNIVLRGIDTKQPIAAFAIPLYPNYNLGAQAGSLCDTLTGIAEQVNHKPLQLSVSPNPVIGDEVMVRYTLEQNQGGELKIENTLGQTVLVQKLPPWSSLQKLRLQSLGSGVYFISLKSGSKRAVVKMVKAAE